MAATDTILDLLFVAAVIEDTIFSEMTDQHNIKR